MRKEAVLTEPLMGGTLYTDELAIEKESAERGIERYYAQAKDAIERGSGAGLKPAERMIVYWMDSVVAMCENAIRSCQNGEADQGRVHYGYVLAGMNARRVAYAAMYHMLSALMTEPSGVPYTRLAGRIGRAVFAEWCVDRMKDIDAETRKNGTRQHGWEALSYKCRHRWKRPTPERVIAFYRLATSSDVQEMRCTAALGAHLLHILQVSCYLPKQDGTLFPALSVKNRKAGRWLKKYAVLEPTAHSIIEEGHAQRCIIRPRFSFMVIPPMPWQQDGDVPGGYIRNRTPLVAFPSRKHKQIIADADMTVVYDHLQRLQEHGWEINKKTLRVAEQLWRDGDVVEGVPNPNDTDLPGRAPDGATDAEIRDAKRARANVYTENVALRSARTAFITMLEEARKFQDRSPIYAPHQMDFRGRCYPLPAALNHHGSDLFRGMMLFSTSGERSEESDRWALIHAANCWGVDKVPYDERVEWARDNLKMMGRVAADPIAEPEWRKAEKPFQFMAACYGLFDESVGSKLPYQADGTCNGLQQYAALGRDEHAAALVNLVRTDKPGDVYTAVLNKVLEVVRADAANGVKAAKSVLPMLKRSVVKQPVMTVVYGVTEYGATDQLFDQLDGVSEDANEESKYLVKVVMASIGDLLMSARLIMSWLSGMARAIAESGEHVEWQTPLGFPCRQDYSNYGSHNINTSCGRLWIVSDDFGPKVGKQSSAFPPNYIHGVDASHLLMTAKGCSDLGIPFGGVHDSFWTNMAGASRLHSVLRGTFFSLHSRDLLGELAAHLRVRYPGVAITDPPPRGNYNVADALDATYMAH